MAVSDLFKPFRLKSLSLRNRIVMAPMTRSFSPGHVPGAEVTAYYKRRALGGVGLIISEGVGVDRPASLNDPKTPVFHGEPALARWKEIVDEVHAAGGAMGPQLWHVGAFPDRFSDWRAPGPIDSPSGLVAPGARMGEPMSLEAIADTIAAFGRAAADARRLGFDTLEIHGAHGYLIDQFFWRGANERTDRYGGATIGERARFGAEVAAAIRKEVGPEFVIIFRLSQWKQQDFLTKLANTPQELEAWVAPLSDAGVDIFHASQRRFWEPEFEGSDLSLAGWLKKVSGKPSITVGSVGLSGEFVASYEGEASNPATLNGLLERLDRGEFDLVAVGRALIVDPDWADKIRDGRESELHSYSRESLKTLF